MDIRAIISGVTLMMRLIWRFFIVLIMVLEDFEV